MRIAYFVHDLSDPAVSRRVRMLLAGGAEVTVLGFRRAERAPEMPGAEVVDLGRTHDGAFGRRIAKVLGAVARSRALKPVLAGADVVMARNLEMLLLAVVARRLHGPAGLVYECLDVHRLMLGPGPAGAALRGLERSLMRAVGLLVVSSPAFVDGYFASRQGVDGHGGLPVLLVENKVLDLTPQAALPVAVRPVGPPWRIGWYGAIRCRGSLDLLSGLAARRPDLVSVEIRGRPAYTEFDDFDAQVARAPGLCFEGPYTADDLPAFYGGVHFAWAIDWFEAGANSAWLLPNRIYEGGRSGAVPLALNGVETGRWLAARGLGVLMDDPATELEAMLEAMTPDRYRALASRAAAASAGDFVAGPEDCRELVQRLGQTQRDLHSGVDVAGPKFDAMPAADRSPLIVIPCLNEAAFIGPLLSQLLADPGLDDPLVVVADGGSTDGTRTIVEAAAARDPRIRLLPNPRRLQSAGVNLAARQFGGDRTWLVRVDAHAGYPDGYVSRLLDAAAETGATSVVVAMETRGEAGFQRAAAAAQSSRLGAGGSAHRLGGVSGWVDHGHHALFRLDAFLACGGYDETFSHNEDAELDVRLARAGGRIWLSDAPAMIYHPRGTPGALWRQYLNYGRGRARTVLKHRTRLRLRQALPLAVAPAVLVALAAPLWWPAVLPALAWAMICLTYGALLGLKRRDTWAALSGPAAMIMHLAWSAGFLSQVLMRRAQGDTAAAELQAAGS